MDHTPTYDYREVMKLSNQLCFPLYAAARKVTALYTPFLTELNLTYTQYLVLLVLWEQDGIPVSEICRRLHLDNGTVSPLLKKLEKEGLLEKSRSPEDERVVLITLTDTGRALQERAKEIPGKVGSCVRLTPVKALTLYQLLYELLDEE
ncbi:MAG: MarR family transcriptional regulator [Oscillospiraceae bacterium]|nr:MarR family transcriptional regulator [Oscillospiraceae bacterium]